MADVFCPICYESIDIVVQNLESVAACGHVFHESCLEKWIGYSRESPKCPFCKASCGPGKHHRLYFQTGREQLDSWGQSLTMQIKDDSLEIDSLRRKVEILKEFQVGDRLKITQLKAEVQETKAREEMFLGVAELTNKTLSETEGKFLKTKQELDASRKEKVLLMKKLEKLERDICATKLQDNVHLSEAEVLNLISAGAGCPRSTDEYIQILAKALVSRNWAYKNLMTTCKEYSFQKDNAERESSKLRTRNEQLQAKMKEFTNGFEMLQNSTLRSMVNTQTNAASLSDTSRSLAGSSNRLSKFDVSQDSPKALTPVGSLDRDKYSRWGPREKSEIINLKRETLNLKREEVNPDPLTHVPLRERETERDTDTMVPLRVLLRATEAERDTDTMVPLRVLLRAKETERYRDTMDRTRDCSVVRECAKSDLKEADLDKSIPVGLCAFPIPIRRERTSRLVEDSIFCNESICSLSETAGKVAGSTSIPRFYLSGQNGPSSRTQIKPPPSFILPPSLRVRTKNFFTDFMSCSFPSQILVKCLG